MITIFNLAEKRSKRNIKFQRFRYSWTKEEITHYQSLSPIAFIRSDNFNLATFLSRMIIFFDDILFNNGELSNYGLPEKNMFWDLLPYTIDKSDDDNGVSFIFYSNIFK